LIAAWIPGYRRLEEIVSIVAPPGPSTRPYEVNSVAASWQGPMTDAQIA